MSAFEAGVSAGRRGAVRVAANIADAGSRLRSPTTAIGRAHVASIPRRRRPNPFAQAGLAVLRLVLPVLLLLCVGIACMVYGDRTVEGWGNYGGRQLTAGLVALPLTFFVIHLTNRRYGAAYALAQIVIAWPAALALLPTLLPQILSTSHLRIASAFAVGLFLAQLAAVIVFDALRGPGWWKAPLFGSLFAGIVFCLIAFPVAFAGTGVNWSADMLGYLMLATAASVLLLIPYGLLRSVVPPLSGFGGY